MLKILRRLLLKVPNIRRRVLVYKLRQKKERQHKHWAQLMHNSGTVHVDGSEIVVDYVDTRMVWQRQVSPRFIDSTAWGVREPEDPISSSNRSNADPSNSEKRLSSNYDRACCGIGPCSVE